MRQPARSRTERLGPGFGHQTAVELRCKLPRVTPANPRGQPERPADEILNFALTELFEIRDERPLTPNDAGAMTIDVDVDWDDVPQATPSTRRVWASEE